MAKKKGLFRRMVGCAAKWECEFGDCEKSNSGGDMVHAHHLERQDDDSGGQLLCVDHHQQTHQEIVDAMKLEGATWKDDPEMRAHQGAANLLSGALQFWKTQDP